MGVIDVSEEVSNFLLGLQAALGARALYGGEHKMVKDAVARAHFSLQAAVLARPEITVGLIDGELAFEAHPLHRLARAAAALTKCLQEAKVDKVTFRKETGRDELEVFIGILDARRKSGGDAGGTLDTAGLRSIWISGIGIDQGGKDQGGKEENQDSAAMKACAADCAKGLDLLGDIAVSLGDGHPIDAAAANAFVGRIIDRLMENKYPLLIAASLKRHDEYSFVHSLNVSVLSLSQAQSLGVNSRLLADIGLAGFLHDAGKLALAGQILRKKEKLTNEEFDQVKMHPLDGAKILVQTPDVSSLVAAASFEHHLRYDRTGYPRKMFGGDLNLASMLVAIADVYDALRSKRSYRAEMAPEDVYAEMSKMSGTHFHPELLDAFFSAVGVYSPGTLVELDDGHVGVVVNERPEEIRRPEVEIWYIKGGGKVRQPSIVDLAEKQATGDYRRSIVRSVTTADGYEMPPKYRVD